MSVLANHKLCEGASAHVFVCNDIVIGIVCLVNVYPSGAIGFESSGAFWAHILWSDFRWVVLMVKMMTGDFSTADALSQTLCF